MKLLGDWNWYCPGGSSGFLGWSVSEPEATPEPPQEVKPAHVPAIVQR